MTRRTSWWIAGCLAAAGLIGCGNESWSSGDRVLVAKCLYDSKLAAPKRFDVVVFKYPAEPTKKLVPYNYIKRLLGLPGEFFAILFGRVYTWIPEDGEENPAPRPNEPPEDWWKHRLIEYPEQHTKVMDRFREGRFQIVRKPPEVMLAMRRIVYDNDFPARDLEQVYPPRWNPKAQSAWTPDARRGLSFDPRDPKAPLDWIRYQHYVRRPIQGPAAAANAKPQLIADVMSYNLVPSEPLGRKRPFNVEDFSWSNCLDKMHWVGDLMLECDVKIESPQGEFRMELSKGPFRYQARFNLESGVCTLVKVEADGKETEIDKKDTRLRGVGEHTVRFANIDARLTVWVDRDMPFGDGAAYPPPEIRNAGEKITDEDLKKRCGPTANDLEPASLAAQGTKLQIHHLRLWRDTYYTGEDGIHLESPIWGEPDNSAWESLRTRAPNLIYIFPGHYLCLGDNSPQSSDGRAWGLVPERLLLGRALMVYYPIHRAGMIR